MKINDVVYGFEEIKNPVLVDLILSSPMQRLKGISQFGIPEKYYHKKTFSRYEHSLGVLILLKRLGASLEEQVAGLLHDVSHSAFSHVIDWLIGDPSKENYQDEALLSFIENSKVPKILEKYGFDYKKIANQENFPLLEKEIPDLCADRIDYSLRELVRNNVPIDGIFSNLDVKNNEIYFKDREKAEFFAENFLKLQIEHWGGNEARARYYVLSKILKKGLEEKIISLNELKTGEDWPILRKLEKKGGGEIQEDLKLLRDGFSFYDSPQGILLEKKFRYVDPKILEKGELKSLSDISEDYKHLLNKERQNSLVHKRILIN